MPIGTNDFIDKFGSQVSIDDGSTSSVANAAFSVAADITPWTNTDDVPQLACVLRCQFATVTSVANKSIIIHGRPVNIQSSNDPVVPSASRFMPLGVFNIYAASTGTDYWFETVIDLPNVKSGQEWEFYLENQTGQTISAGWAMWGTPKTQGPK